MGIDIRIIMSPEIIWFGINRSCGLFVVLVAEVVCVILDGVC